MAKGALVGLKGLRRWLKSFGRREHGDGDQGIVFAADYHNASIGCPGDCETFATESNSCSAGSTTYVPEATSSVTRN